ncbi:DUF3347 domain-containing protein [Pedobacter mucosus]|uniref:DUF3347 domain-containing protein n=1 Tax=Pedobacter mucosus TaxID=2895286 RepID=UPI001EE3C18E|nr:DUF3347 domain-containing protein [Pedobacter mucosus]UKT65666.1 DUF3347 domain-containing protein [Pedobacter mucosus]
MKRILGIAALVLLMACNQKNKSAELKNAVNADSSKTKNDITINDSQKSVIFYQYEDLKNNLVKSDAAAAQKSASTLKVSLAGFKGCELTAEIAEKIASTGDIVSQRKNFTVLSADLIALIKNTIIDKGVIYVQHCPMANKGDGGDWLSTEKEIKNPYYGEEMLECGRIVEEIKAKRN